MKELLVINGPNLKALGKREPAIYGKETYEDLVQRLKEMSQNYDCRIECVETSYEGQVIDWLYEAEGQYEGIIINAGALTHYSYAIRDAIVAIGIPVIEVHISNVHKREAFRHESVIGPVVTGSIIGLGLRGYELACQFFLNIN